MNAKKISNPTNYISLVAHFVEFLTVSIHVILYERQLYAADSFISARKYNYPVRQSRHPDLCAWISEAVNHVEKQLMQCAVDKISLVIFSPWGEPLERFVFDLERFPVMQRQDWYTDFAPDSAQVDKFNVANFEEQFRAVMSRLAFCHRNLEPLPNDCTFNIAVELREDAEPPISHPQPWIPSVPSLQWEKSHGNAEAKASAVGCDLGGVATCPIRLVDAGPMSFEIWIEESQTRLKSLNREAHSDDGNALESKTDMVNGAPMQSHASQKKATNRVQANNEDDEFDDHFPDELSQFSFSEFKD